MNKLLKISRWILSFMLLMIVGLYFLLFSAVGSHMLKPYIKNALEEKIGMPVEITSFDLAYGTSSLDFSINKQAAVHIEVSSYNLLKDSYEGRYAIKTDQFSYENKRVNKVDMKGNFKYLPEDIYLEGEGTALDAKVDYRFNIIDNLPQQIILNIEGAQLSEVLQLSGQPAIAQGNIDVKVNIPDIGGDRENIYGYMELKNGIFDPKQIEALYGYTIPEQSYVHGKIDAKLEEENVKIAGDVQSNLFSFKIKNALVSIFSEDWSTEYALDVKDMRILTQNKLVGALDLSGKIHGKGKIVQGTVKSDFLEGEADFSAYLTAKFNLKNISLEKVFSLLNKPDYVKGKVDGIVHLYWDFATNPKFYNVFCWDKLRDAKYDFLFKEGTLKSDKLVELLHSKKHNKNVFSGKIKGTLHYEKLKANASLDSEMVNLKFSSIQYDLKKKTLTSQYDMLVHDIHMFSPKTKTKTKGSGSVNLKGQIKRTDTWSISTDIKGLAEKLHVSYDNKTATLEASELFVEKLLVLSGMPPYVKGTVNSQINFTHLKPYEGSFWIKGETLVTNPDEMKRLIGEALETKVQLDTSGKFKEGKGHIASKIKSSLGDISLLNMHVDPEKKMYKGSYLIDIPQLKTLHKVIDQKLYGPLVLKGDFSKDKVVNLSGATQTLGGEIAYTLVGDTLNAEINNVPLENILGLLGHKKDFLGKAFGKGKYDLKQKSGVIDLDIKSFQIKPSPTTNTIKMLIGKDPTRVMFSSTKFHADIKGKITHYTLDAKGSRSNIQITEGRVDKVHNTHTAKLKFVYEKYTVYGEIKGTVGDPKVTIDTSAILKDKIDQKLQNKIEEALGGKAGEFLRGLKF